MSTRGADGGTVEAVRALLTTTEEACADHPEVAERLREQRRRLDEPLRVALVGRVKAGKSTLLNALVGARIAPTDAGECTRVVTHYRHGSVPRVELQEVDGGRRALPVRRVEGGLELDLAGRAPEEVAALVVDWPAADLATASLVDTPGTASLSTGTSARTGDFLAAADRLPGADAVVFLTRQMQPDDVAFLTAFQARTAGAGLQTTTLTVLSRADEIGAGRLDSLRAAADVARRMARDPAVRAVSATVVPVAGLLAVAGRTLRHADFVALRSIAQGERDAADTLLLSADRFCRDDDSLPVARGVRASLLERLGLFGVRLSVALVRAGIDDAQALADELVARSGLAELQRLLTVHFTRRGEQLKVGTALRTVEGVLREVPVPGSEALWRELERLRLGAQDLVQLDVLARSRTPDGLLPAALRAEGERLLGAEGPDPAARLGLPADAPVERLRAAAVDALDRWWTAAGDPLAPRATRDAIDVVVRACEAVLAGLPAPSAPVAQPAAGGAGEQQAQGDEQQAG